MEEAEEYQIQEDAREMGTDEVRRRVTSRENKRALSVLLAIAAAHRRPDRHLQEAGMDEEEMMEEAPTGAHDISLLEQTPGISSNDVKKLKEAGFHTMESVSHDN